MLRQIFVVSALNFRSLMGRFWQSMVIVVGLAATIGVMLSMLSLSTGMREAYSKAGADILFGVSQPVRLVTGIDDHRTVRAVAAGDEAVLGDGADREHPNVHRMECIEERR